MAKQRQPSVYRIQVLDRAFQLLDVLAQNPVGLSVTEISARLKLHKSTAHRLIMVLDVNRYITKDDASAKYHLGHRLVELGSAVLSRLDLPEVAKPHLRHLVAQTGESAHLGVLRGGEVVLVFNAHNGSTLRTPSTLGARTPAHCTSLGKAILAFAAPDEIDAYMRTAELASFTKNTITTAPRFRAELQKTRDRGYSIDNEEREAGLRCLGAPVRDSSGDVVAGISIAGPSARVSENRSRALSSAVIRAANKISTALGYRSRK